MFKVTYMIKVDKEHTGLANIGAETSVGCPTVGTLAATGLGGGPIIVVG